MKPFIWQGNHVTAQEVVESLKAETANWPVESHRIFWKELEANGFDEFDNKWQAGNNICTDWLQSPYPKGIRLWRKYENRQYPCTVMVPVWVKRDDLLFVHEDAIIVKSGYIDASDWLHRFEGKRNCWFAKDFGTEQLQQEAAIQSLWLVDEKSNWTLSPG